MSGHQPPDSGALNQSVEANECTIALPLFPNKNGAQDPFKKVSFENLGELIILSGLATG